MDRALTPGKASTTAAEVGAVVRYALLRVSAVAAVAAIWEAAPRARWVDATFVPPLSAVLATLRAMALDGSLSSHALVSSFRGVLGILVAAAVAFPIGLALGVFGPRWYAALEPALRVGSQINPFALLSVFLLFFGAGETVKVVAVAWVALWPILFYTVSGVRDVDPLWVKCARAHAAPTWMVVARVIVPAALPAVFVGVRLGTGLVFFTLVAAEMLGASRGLGWFVHSSAANYRIQGIYAGALALTVLGYALSSAVRGLERRLFPSASGWHGRAQDRAGGVRGRRRLPDRGLAIATIAALLLLLAAGAREAFREPPRGQDVIPSGGEGG